MSAQEVLTEQVSQAQDGGAVSAREPTATLKPNATAVSTAVSTAPPGPGAPDAGVDQSVEELRSTITALQAENAELRTSLLRWRVAAVSKWAETAADAMKTAAEVKDLKRQLRDSESDRLDVSHRHHQLNQVHHQLNERYLTLSRRYGKLSRLTELTGSQVKRRLHRAMGSDQS